MTPYDVVAMMEPFYGLEKLVMQGHLIHLPQAFWSLPVDQQRNNSCLPEAPKMYEMRLQLGMETETRIVMVI